MRAFLRPAAATLAAMLFVSGCGGGSSDPAPTPAPAPTSRPPRPLHRRRRTTRSRVTLLAADQCRRAATYGSATTVATLRTASFDEVNRVRSAMGIGRLAQSATLDAMAQAHADYLGINNELSHTETPGKPGFTGEQFADRFRASGYLGSATELVAVIRAVQPGGALEGLLGQCIWSLMNAPYHTNALSGGARQIGVGIGAYGQTGSYACVAIVALPQGASPQLPAQDNPQGVYPFPDQTGVPSRFSGESPDPIPDLSKPRGHFVSARMGSRETYSTQTRSFPGSAYTVTRFELKDASGNLLAARVIADPDVRAGPGMVLTPDPQNLRLGDYIALLPLVDAGQRPVLRRAARLRRQRHGAHAGVALHRERQPESLAAPVAANVAGAVHPVARRYLIDACDENGFVASTTNITSVWRSVVPALNTSIATSAPLPFMV